MAIYRYYFIQNKSDKLTVSDSIIRVHFFVYTENQRQRHNRKYYSIDTDPRRSVVTQCTTDYGKDFENLVYLSLRAKTKDIAYWRDKGEVDFVVQTDRGITRIQVTVGEPQARHEDALAEF